MNNNNGQERHTDRGNLLELNVIFICIELYMYDYIK